MQAGISGNLTKDPQITETDKGVVVRFAVASSPRWRDKGGAWQQGETVFARVEWWGPRAAAFAAQAKQGTAVVVVGEWRAQSWTDDASGEKRRRQYVAAEVAGIVPSAAEAPAKADEQADETTRTVEQEKPQKLTPRSQPAAGEDDDFWGAS